MMTSMRGSMAFTVSISRASASSSPNHTVGYKMATVIGPSAGTGRVVISGPTLGSRGASTGAVRGAALGFALARGGVHGIGVELRDDVRTERLVRLSQQIHVVVADGRREGQLVGAHVDELLDRTGDLIGIADA